MVNFLENSQYLEQIRIQFIEKIDNNYQDLTTEDFSALSIKPAMFVIFLHSALECFFKFCFKEVIKKQSLISNDAEQHLVSKLEKFDLKTDLPLYTSLFLPECYDNSQIRKIIIDKRNAYAHRIINKFGKYIFQEEKYKLDKQDIEQYVDYSKDLMQKIVENIQEKITAR